MGLSVGFGAEGRLPLGQVSNEPHPAKLSSAVVIGSPRMMNR